MMRFSDKTVLITGAAGGIGSALVQRFVSEGACVVASDINADGLEALKLQIAKDLQATKFGSLETLILDITKRDQVAEEINQICEKLGPIDALVNNAGWDIPVQSIDSDPAAWEKLISIYLNGPLNLQHAVTPRMVERGPGKVLNNP